MFDLVKLAMCSYPVESDRLGKAGMIVLPRGRLQEPQPTQMVSGVQNVSGYSGPFCGDTCFCCC